MKRIVSAAFSVALIAVYFGIAAQLGGCVAALPLAVFGGEVVGGTMMEKSHAERMAASDSNVFSFTLSHGVSATAFANAVRTAARNNQYQITHVASMSPATGDIVQVMLTKQQTSVFIFGKSWYVSVNVKLASDGKTVTISPTVRGDGSPSVEEIAKDLKNAIVQQFA